jgi:tryptophan-rich sensory protein
MIKIVLFTIPLAAGLVSGLLSYAGLGSWFKNLQKPLWMPPASVFGPVWTCLYILMGFTLTRIWQSEDVTLKRNALLFFTIQLGLNFFWSIIFFRWQNIGLACIEIVITWICIAVYKIDRTAALVQIPYFIWVSFASILTFTLYRLNA